MWVFAGGAGLLQAGSLDPYIYTGYVNHYGALLERYGVTYYSTRVGTVFPQHALVKVLGDALAGYYAWHYVLAVVALGSVYGMARRYYGVATAAVATVAMIAVPWLAKELTWDYVDGPAIAYLLLGMFFILGLRSRPALRWFGAGCSFSLAIACNFFTAAVIVAFLGAWLAFDFPYRSIRSRIRAALWCVAGLAVVQAALGVLMEVAYPKAGYWFMEKNLRTSEGLLSGGGRDWYVSFGDALRALPILWVPIVAGCTAAVLALATRGARIPPERRRLVLLAAANIGACWLLFVIMHVEGMAVLSLDFYVSYFIPSFVLVVIVTIGEILMQLGPVRARRAAPIAVGALVVAFLVFRFAPESLPPLRVVLVLGVALVLVLQFLRRWPLAVSLVALAVILVLPFAFSSYPAVVHSDQQAFERDVYRHATDFQDGVLAAVPIDETVGFWYDDGDGWLTSVQSTFLWGYSRLSSHQAMPQLDAKERKRAGDFDYLVLLSPRAGPIRAGARALCRAGVDLGPLTRQVLHGETVDLHYAVFARIGADQCLRGLPA